MPTTPVTYIDCKEQPVPRDNEPKQQRIDTASVYASQNKTRRLYRTPSTAGLSHRQPASAGTYRDGFRIPGSDKGDIALRNWHLKYSWWSFYCSRPKTAYGHALWTATQQFLLRSQICRESVSRVPKGVGLSLHTYTIHRATGWPVSLPSTVTDGHPLTDRSWGSALQHITFSCVWWTPFAMIFALKFEQRSRKWYDETKHKFKLNVRIAPASLQLNTAKFSYWCYLSTWMAVEGCKFKRTVTTSYSFTQCHSLP